MKENVLYESKGYYYYFFAISTEKVYGFHTKSTDRVSASSWSLKAWEEVFDRKNNMQLSKTSIDNELIESAKKQIIKQIMTGWIE